MKKILKLIYSLAISMAEIAVIYLGTVEELPWAMNLTKFFCWFVFAVSLLFYIGVQANLEKAKKTYQEDLQHRLAFPLWVSSIAEIVMVILLVMAGWWLSAIAFTVGILILKGTLMSLKEMAHVDKNL